MAGNIGTSFSRREIARHTCHDCGVNVIRCGDYCLLRTGIWRGKLGLGLDDNLCIACIEKRLGRKLSLRRGDFADVPWVEGFAVSDTLLDRYGFPRHRNKPKKEGA